MRAAMSVTKIRNNKRELPGLTSGWKWLKVAS